MGNKPIKGEQDSSRVGSEFLIQKLNIDHTIDSRVDKNTCISNLVFPGDNKNSLTDSMSASLTEHNNTNTADEHEIISTNRFSSCTDISSISSDLSNADEIEGDVQIGTKNTNVLSPSLNTGQSEHTIITAFSGGFMLNNDSYHHHTLSSDRINSSVDDQKTYTIDDGDEDSFFSVLSEDGLDFVDDLPFDADNHDLNHACVGRITKQQRRRKSKMQRLRKTIAKTEKSLKCRPNKVTPALKNYIMTNFGERETTVVGRLIRNVAIEKSDNLSSQKTIDTDDSKITNSQLENSLSTNMFLQKVFDTAFYNFGHRNVTFFKTGDDYGNQTMKQMYQLSVHDNFDNGNCSSVCTVNSNKEYFFQGFLRNNLNYVLAVDKNELKFIGKIRPNSTCFNLAVYDEAMRSDNSCVVNSNENSNSDDESLKAPNGTCIVSPSFKTESDESKRDDHDQTIEITINNMNSNDNFGGSIPTTQNIENIKNMPLLNDTNDLDFISRIGGSGDVAESLRTQSLYMRFDPLLVNNSQSSNNSGDEAMSNDLANLSLDGDYYQHRTIIIHSPDSKLNPEDTNENESESIGKLISVTPNKSPRKKKIEKVRETIIGKQPRVVTPKSSPRFNTDSDDLTELKSLLMKQMKREETLKEEMESLKRENEQSSLNIQSAEKEISNLKNALEASQNNEKKLQNELRERIKNKQQLSIVMEEYEKTISQMVSKKEDEKLEYDSMLRKMEAERDNAMQHLNNLENAFNDVHQKYERGKIVNEALKKNEEILKRSLNESEATVKTVENKYELLKSHATSQLDKANQELELISQNYEKEQAKLQAMLRKAEIQINSLRNALDQKTKENNELTSVCDELITKLSNHSNA